MNILVKYIKHIYNRRRIRVTKMLLLAKVISLSTVFAQDNIRNNAPEVAAFVKDEFPVLEDRYLGEEPPGLIPVAFAPDIVSPDGLFEGGVFSPDMRNFYFTRKNGKYKERTFFVIRYENNSWGNESETDIKYPGYSRDGNRI